MKRDFAARHPGYGLEAWHREHWEHWEHWEYWYNGFERTGPDDFITFGREGCSRMPTLSDWKVPPEDQPKPADYDYDLAAV
jgi:hypothetical protein